MPNISIDNILFSMIISLFLLGTVTLAIGIIILISRAMGRDVRTIAKQTKKMVEKGITQELSGLVGNASALLSATNQMIRTTSGVGVFLTILGLLLLSASVALLLFVQG
ncbi:MAG: hypothetical protein IZT55_06250 [Anaerolineae bacterium]|nr:hypothetical protein [Anaerolineae bacterium]